MNQSAAPSVAERLALAQADLRAGRLDSARDQLAALAQEPTAHVPANFLLAQLEAQAGRVEAERGALSAILSREARHIGALLARGDLERRIGDDRAAVRFYRTAIAQASVSQLPPAARALVDEAARFVAEAGTRFQEGLLHELDSAGLREGGLLPPRAAYALDVMLGRKPLYGQEPSMFLFPGLAQRPVFDRSDFGWVADFEAQTDAIHAELQALLADDATFAPYVQSSPDAPAPANPLLDNDDWGAFHLFRDGRPHPENAPRCPQTMAALSLAPQPAIGTRSPMALFSRLRPGTHIQPHSGVFNTRLICHLPLVVPPDCGIRVGPETHEWVPGELFIFDDSFNHEAWNRSGADRTILLFEIWRPDLCAEERDAITAILAAVEHHGPQPQDA